MGVLESLLRGLSAAWAREGKRAALRPGGDQALVVSADQETAEPAGDARQPPRRGGVVGVVGLRGFGAHAARHLCRAAATVPALARARVCVWPGATPEAAAELEADFGSDAAGSSASSRVLISVGSAAQVGMHSDVVLLWVESTPHWARALLQLLPGLRPGCLVVACALSDPPAILRKWAACLALQRVALVDAAFTGSASAARGATLTALVGGSEANVARVRPLLNLFASRIVHAGKVVMDSKTIRHCEDTSRDVNIYML